MYFIHLCFQKLRCVERDNVINTIHKNVNERTNVCLRLCCTCVCMKLALRYDQITVSRSKIIQNVAFSTEKEWSLSERHGYWRNDSPCNNQRQEGETESDCWKNVIKSVYGVLSLTHKSRTTCSLEVITLGSRDILHVNSESLHLKLGVKIPFPPIDKLNHLQVDRIWCRWGLEPPLLFYHKATTEEKACELTLQDEDAACLLRVSQISIHFVTSTQGNPLG